jgi:hypothetical protein
MPTPPASSVPRRLLPHRPHVVEVGPADEPAGDAERAARDIHRILRRDGGAPASERVVWFAAPAAPCRRLAGLLVREGLDDFMAVEALLLGVEVPTWGCPAAPGSGGRSRAR